MIKNNSGATSVFVIMLMVVLTAFGIAALTTSNAGLKLSRKTSQWFKEYYLLEGEAERVLALVDESLIIAKQDAESVKDAKTFSENYNLIAYKELLELSKHIKNMEIKNNPLTVIYTVTEDKKEYPKNITVVLKIPEIDNKTKNSRLKNYEIYQWKEWQEKFEFDNSIEFEDPQFENPQFYIE